MIAEFSVTNYLSINETQTISFKTANRSMDYDSSLCKTINPTTKIIKIALLYGANASGKSNLIKAFQFVKNIVTRPAQNKEEEIGFIPFLFDKKTKESPGIFSLTFFINSTKFIYKITVSKEYILNEKLLYYPSRQPANLFSRHYDQDANITEIVFGDRLSLSQADKTILKGNTIKTISVLASYSKSNVSNQLLEDVYQFFHKTLLDVITPSTNLMSWTNSKVKNSKTCKKLLLELLEKADFNIVDIDITSEELDIDKEFLDKLKESDTSSNLIEALSKKKHITAQTLSFLHTTQAGTESLPFDLESNGTRRYYGLGGVLSELLSGKHILAIDELENSLHPELLKHYIKTFLVNSDDSQLIITAHDRSLLEADFMQTRRDLVWFCEKSTSGGSQFTRGSAWQMHKNNSLANFYKLGKLGAVPELGSAILNTVKEDCNEENS